MTSLTTLIIIMMNQILQRKIKLPEEIQAQKICFKKISILDN